MSMVPTGIYAQRDVVKETQKAVLVTVSNRSTGSICYGNSNDTNVWVPKSKIEWRHTPYGDELWVPAWLARNGL